MNKAFNYYGIERRFYFKDHNNKLDNHCYYENFIPYNFLNEEDIKEECILHQHNPNDLEIENLQSYDSELKYPKTINQTRNNDDIRQNTIVHQKILSDQQRIKSEKKDEFYERKILAGNPEKLRRILILDEAPNFCNPFIENTGNNYIHFNPYYTNDYRKINLNMNGYLFRRFKTINIKQKLKYFSKEEREVLFVNTFLRNFCLFAIPISLLMYLKTRNRLSLTMTLLNTWLLPHSHFNTIFIFYNSYLRNFNEYNDEQVDYILTFNSDRYPLSPQQQQPKMF